LYGFVGNDGANKLDLFGMFTLDLPKGLEGESDDIYTYKASLNTQIRGETDHQSFMVFEGKCPKCERPINIKVSFGLMGDNLRDWYKKHNSEVANLIQLGHGAYEGYLGDGGHMGGVADDGKKHANHCGVVFYINISMRTKFVGTGLKTKVWRELYAPQPSPEWFLQQYREQTTVTYECEKCPDDVVPKY
jgi:hypothetical protein